MTPGASSGTRIIECRACRSASGSLTPITIANVHSGRIAPLDHHLRPLTTYSSPSLVIRVAMLVASDDATSGSVIEKQDRISASSSGRRYCSCWSSVPNMAISSMFPVSGAAQFMASGASPIERPDSSAIGA